MWCCTARSLRSKRSWHVSQADEDESLLPPEQEDAVLSALEAALRPAELDARVNERLIEQALEDPFAEPTPEELAESARLRDALDQGTPYADASLLRALGAPFGAGSDENDASQAAAHARALEAMRVTSTAATQRSRANVVYGIFGAGSALLAAAAAVTLLVGAPRGSAPADVDASVYIKPHSTAPLFAGRFETGDTTARMDVIASARSRELRDNRFAAWGVR